MSKVKNISERFAKFIKKTELQGKQIAGLVGISEQWLINLKKGKNEPSKRILEKLKLNFNLNPEWILDGSGKMFLGEQKRPTPEQIISPKDKIIDSLKSTLDDKIKIIQFLESENQQLKEKTQQLELENKKLKS
jgi:transcriptional regulator with XRE-family HTH domain